MINKEHPICFNHNHSSKPVIELFIIEKSQEGYLSTIVNELAFILEGRIKYTFDDGTECEGKTNQILFMPTNSRCSYIASEDTILILFKIYGSVSVTMNFSLEDLYNTNFRFKDYHVPEVNNFGSLEINERLKHFLEGIKNCIDDGLKCLCWFDLKVREFFLLLRVYYPKEDIQGFLYAILSGDAAFSEYVRLHWKDYRTVGELAESMCMTPKRFSARFVSIFGTTP